ARSQVTDSKGPVPVMPIMSRIRVCVAVGSNLISEANARLSSGSVVNSLPRSRRFIVSFRLEQSLVGRIPAYAFSRRSRSEPHIGRSSIGLDGDYAVQRWGRSRWGTCGGCGGRGWVMVSQTPRGLLSAPRRAGRARA